MKVLSIIGTRPEVIKMAPVIQALDASSNFKSIVCATSQHRDMQDEMLSLFDIKVDYDLDIMKHGQDLFHITTSLVDKLKDVLITEQPNVVLVQGDTATAFCGALAAFYLRIPIGHVEAGLRTYDLKAPFPEEGNRAMISKICTFHFAPTETAKQNLLKEMVPEKNIIVTGNTVIDALFWMKNHINEENVLASLDESVRSVLAAKKPFVLITGHRRESFGIGFEGICSAVSQCANKYPNWHFFYPIHLNPNVRGPVIERLNHINNVHLFEPIGYGALVYLLSQCYLVLTDSGGIQEEAPSMGKPVLVMRTKTERPEGIAAGTARLVGVDADIIVKNVVELIEHQEVYMQMAKAVNPYGDGQAAAKIIKHLANVFQKQEITV